MDIDWPVMTVNLARRLCPAFERGYICGRTGWGKQYNPYKLGEFHRIWLDGWSVGRAGYEIVLIALDD